MKEIKGGPGEAPSPAGMDMAGVPSIAVGSTARFVADGLNLVAGLATGIVTARWLGPAGKGTLSALLYVGAILTYVCSLGLGDAAIVMIGRGKATLQEVVEGSMAGVGTVIPLGWGALAVAAWMGQWWGILGAVVIAAVLLPVATVSYLLISVLNARERVVLTSTALGVSTVATAAAIVVLVAVVELGVFGALLGSLFGTSVGLIILVRDLSRQRVSLMPRWRPSFLYPGLRLGAMLEGSHVIVALSQRVDLLIVYGLLGEAPAGQYSIASVVAQLVVYAPFALSIASFPRIAYVDKEASRSLIVQTLRIGTATALVVALLLYAVIPVTIPFVFGTEFARATSPALVLLIGSFVWSQQWLLTRGLAARGRPEVLFASFGTSLLALVVFDYLLIPAFGLMGAATASSIASVMGWTIAMLFGRQSFAPPIRLLEMVPTLKDFRAMLALPRTILRRG